MGYNIQHGGNLLQAIEEFGGNQDDWLDLSTGISPFTIDLPAFGQNVWRCLPDPRYVELLEGKAKAFYQATSECLAVPGSQFAIQHLPKILDGCVGVLQPTYGEYAASFTRDDAPFVSLSDIHDIGGASSVVLANPNNPDGRLYSSQVLFNLADQLRARNGYLVVDEAFMAVDDVNSLLGSLDRAENVIILRSIGKFFGLAGIRLGFVFCSAVVRQRLAAYLGPWAVSGPALALADHIFSHPRIVDDLKGKITIRHQQMDEMLGQCGLKLAGKNDLFFLVENQNAQNLHLYLKQQKILTRIFDYNLEWMRIGLTANLDEDNRLLAAFNGFAK